MAEAAPPWQENQPYEVRVTAKPLRSLTYDVLPPAPSHDTTAVVQEEGTAVVVRRAAHGAEREFRGRAAKARARTIRIEWLRAFMLSEQRYTESYRGLEPRALSWPTYGP